MKMVSTFSVFHFSMKLSSCACAAEVSSSTTVSTAVDPSLAPAFSRARRDHVVGARLAVLIREHRDRLALERSLLVEEVDQHRGRLLLRGVGRQQQAGRRLVDPRLLELVADVDGLVVTRQAELPVAGEVDEHAEHREHVVVVGELRAHRERARLRTRERRVLHVHGVDRAAADAPVRVDVVDEDLRGLLLVAAGEVDEVGDRLVVDDRDAELDLVGRHAVTEVGERGRRPWCRCRTWPWSCPTRCSCCCCCRRQRARSRALRSWRR